MDIRGSDKLTNNQLVYKCPECGKGNQIIRFNTHTQDHFIACTQYPQCKWTSELPESLRMRLSGQSGLFDE